MAAVHEDGEVGFEEGILWLPSHVVDEACDTKVYRRQRPQIGYEQQQVRHHRWPGGPKSQFSRSYERAKVGNGMQAIFLGSGQRSCGTGVFLPQRAGTKFQPTKKGGCGPVLVPARVVEALNLNVQAALGLQVSPPQGLVQVDNNSSKKKTNEDRDASKQSCGVISENQSYSPEMFLPKEWTY